MKFMFIMRVVDEQAAANDTRTMEEMINAMGAFNESMINAGVLIGGDGLAPAEEGFAVDFSTNPPTVQDGAYGPAAVLFNGFWVLKVSDRASAEHWARLVPLGPGAAIEVRRITGVNDFENFAENAYIHNGEHWRAELGDS